MKKICLPALIMIGLAAVFIGCKKKSDKGCNEAAIQVVTTPTTLGTHVEPPAPGPAFPLNVNITSGMPAVGVTIEVIAKPETPANATPFFTESRSSTTLSNDFTITGTPAATSCIVNITVTSKSCNSNKWTGSYRYSRK